VNAQPAASATLRLSRLAAAVFHLLASGSVAVVGALLIFRIWYPPPFDVIAGGRNLFLLLVSVDVVLGPALTFVVASPGKSIKEFRRDLLMIVLLQCAALAYGVLSIAQARPVWVSFEIDRFRVVTASDVDVSQLDEAPPDLRKLPWFGPRLIAATKPTDPNERMRAIDLALAGFDLSMIPRNWRSYAAQSDEAWRRARPVVTLFARYPTQRAEAERISASVGEPLDQLRFLPLVSRQSNGVAVMAAPDAKIVGYLPVDGFF
jgi:hypothetical protein